MVDRLAPGESRLDLPGEKGHLVAGHVRAPPRLHEALVGLGLRHPGRVGELPQGAGRAPPAAVADPGGPVRATAPLPLVVPAPPLAAHPRAGGHFLAQPGSHVLRRPQVLRCAQSFPGDWLGLLGWARRLRRSSRETLVVSTPSPSAIQARLLPSTAPFSIPLRISRVRWA